MIATNTKNTFIKIDKLEILATLILFPKPINIPLMTQINDLRFNNKIDKTEIIIEFKKFDEL